MGAAGRRLTVQDLLAMPAETRCQLIEGNLVMEPSPEVFHQQILMNMSGPLDAFVRAKSLGKVFVAPLDVYLSKFDVLQPDLMFVSAANSRILRKKGIFGGPDLVIEILSRSTAWLDTRTKRGLYAKHGVKELWLVDPPLLQIHRYDFSRDSVMPTQSLSESDTVVSPLLPGLTIPVVDIFKE